MMINPHSSNNNPKFFDLFKIISIVLLICLLIGFAFRLMAPTITEKVVSTGFHSYTVYNKEFVVLGKFSNRVLLTVKDENNNPQTLKYRSMPEGKQCNQKFIDDIIAKKMVVYIPYKIVEITSSNFWRKDRVTKEEVNLIELEEPFCYGKLWVPNNEALSSKIK